MVDVNFLDYCGGVGGTIVYWWFTKEEATVAFEPLGIKAVASFDYDLYLVPWPLLGPPVRIMNSVFPQTLVFNFKNSAFSSKYFLWGSSPSLNISGKNRLHIPFSSSLIKPLSTAKHGIVMNISDSQVSTISPKNLYFLEAYSIAWLSACS